MPRLLEKFELQVATFLGIWFGFDSKLQRKIDTKI